MLQSARYQALPMESLYAPRELARGSANGTAAIFPFYLGKAGNPLSPPPPLSALSFTLYDHRTTSAPQLLALASGGGTERWAANLGANTNAPTRTLESSNLPAVNCDGKRSLRRCAEGVEIKNRFAGTAQSRIVSPSAGTGGMKTTSDSWVSLLPTRSRRSWGSSGTPSQQMRLCVERGASRKKKKSRK